ncbi:hypothetical protein [Maritimibacter alkaliphilus]|uniref:hypothetical protein n=1 Tax=Maritimibacter alkaliphilus TaxID=404236 RepID=UPI001C96CA61|nr:hypothetical protein [Maritimibacter alkaliphilus]MBY6091059.1 hypothetical protein [Maritimibacter alkaliphilus]
MSALVELLAGLAALIAVVFAGKAVVTRKAKSEAKAAQDLQALTDTLDTRKRIDDATRPVSEPDDARDRLQQFGRGSDTPPER